MKSLVFIVAMLSFYVGPVFGNSHPGPEGVWYNANLHKKVVLEFCTGGINIKGLHSQFTWIRFDRTSPDTYSDYRGNIIYFISPYRIEYFNKRRRQLLYFRPLEVRASPDRNWGYHDDYHRFGNTERGNNYDHYSEDNRRSERSKEGNTGSYETGIQFSIDEAEGTWTVDEVNKVVYIVSTRDGLKARFKDDSKWYTYTQNTADTHKFTGANGETYQWVSENIMVWISGNKDRRFTLRKISNDLD